MKRFLYICAVLSAINSISYGQEFMDKMMELDPIVVKSKNTPNKKLFEGMVFSEFTNGFIYYKTGGIASARLNYDAVYKRMLFLDDGGEYRILGDLERIAKIKIADRIFIRSYGDTFLEVISSVNDNAIYKAHRNDFTNRGTTGPYGVISQAFAVQSIGNISFAGSTSIGSIPTAGSFKFENPDLKTVDQSYYCIYNKKSQIVPIISINSLVSIFGHGHKIRSFAKQHDIDIKNIEDVTKILEFCYSLPEE